MNRFPFLPRYRVVRLASSPAEEPQHNVLIDWWLLGEVQAQIGLKGLFAQRDDGFGLIGPGGKGQGDAFSFGGAMPVASIASQAPKRRDRRIIPVGSEGEKWDFGILRNI